MTETQQDEILTPPTSNLQPPASQLQPKTLQPPASHLQPPASHLQPPATSHRYSLIDLLLRDRASLLSNIEEGNNLAGLARSMILTIIVGAGVFGVALGLYRGGAQIAYAGLKLPFVILFTAAISTSALSALRYGIEGFADLRRDLSLVLSSLALTSLVLAALAPLVMLAVTWDFEYHSIILIVVGCCVVGGVVGLSLFMRGSREITGSGRYLVVGVTLMLVALVGIQMTWTMRPYLVRPRTESVPFIRSLEGSFIDSVSTSTKSAMGIFERDEAPLPEQWRKP